jgi:hypothetical protein
MLVCQAEKKKKNNLQGDWEILVETLNTLEPAHLVTHCEGEMTCPDS